MVAAEEMLEFAPCMIYIFSLLTRVLIFSKGLAPCQKQVRPRLLAWREFNRGAACHRLPLPI
jgi:hypothetical protein